MSEINVTPLVDVMLVLLVIFIITAPLLAYALRLDLPDVKAAAAATRPDTVKLAIEADGTLRWNDERIDDAQLTLRLQESAKKQPQPELHLLADKGTRYEAIARVMSAAQLAGITKLGFVTDPPQSADAPAGAAAPVPAKP
jgi:biopolymer transport protein ExbD